MSPERIEILDKLGFVWDAKTVKATKNSLHTSAWRGRFEELVKFGKQHNGSLHVPSSTPLGHWVITQRADFNRMQRGEPSAMTEERLEALNSIQFDWRSRYQMLWEERIEELREYKKKFGTTIVPLSYKDNPKLANWVSTQRKNYNLLKEGKPSAMTSERIKQLDDMGFVWNRWEYEFERATKNDC